MKHTKRQRQEMRDQEFCKKYLTADWDGCAANEYFANKVDLKIADKYLFKPKIELFDNLRDIDIAENNVYAGITHLAFEKSKLLAFLSGVTINNITVPDNIKNNQKYIDSYLSTVATILKNINIGNYDFQKIQ